MFMSFYYSNYKNKKYFIYFIPMHRAFSFNIEIIS